MGMNNSLKRNSHQSLALALAFCLSWMLATIFIDFLAVPAVFQTVTSRDEAASLGVTIFTRFNYIEIILALFLCILSVKSKRIISLVLIVFPLLYGLYLSPNIDKMNKLKMATIDEDPKMEKIQADLDFYHNFYVKADSAKLLLLILLFGLQLKDLYKKEETL